MATVFLLTVFWLTRLSPPESPVLAIEPPRNVEPPMLAITAGPVPVEPVSTRPPERELVSA